MDDAVSFFFADADGFASGLETVLRAAYSALFADHSDAAWDLPHANLAGWFRIVDKTSTLVAGRQATTFLTLAALAGHGELKISATGSKATAPVKKTALEAKAAPARKAAEAKSMDTDKASTANHPQQPDRLTLPDESSVGLTVRIEVNLPANGTPEEYDSIFASIRKHIINRD